VPCSNQLSYLSTPSFEGRRLGGGQSEGAAIL
jgi:hypothetical protein